jgi:hypothetical protein
MMEEQYFLNLIDALQIVVKSQGETIRMLQHNDSVNSKVIVQLNNRITELEISHNENIITGDDFGDTP